MRRDGRAVYAVHRAVGERQAVDPPADRPRGDGHYDGPVSATRPEYKGAPLDEARGPGLGCFWFQVALLALLVVITPIGVVNAWPLAVTGGLLFLTIGLLFFVGQTAIFLLRLVAADRRSRRRPLRTGTSKTVGQLEDDEEPTEPKRV